MTLKIDKLCNKGMLKAFKAVGSKSRLATLLGITNQAIGQWQKVPIARVLDVEKFTKVSRCALRPDIYPPQN